MSHQWTHIKFAAVNAVCLPQLQALLANWLRDGRLHGREWVALNPTRADRRAGSFRVNVDSGFWADFATDDRGGDPVSLYAYLNGLSQVASARALAASWGATA